MARAAGKIGMKLLTIAVGIPVGIVTKKLVDRVFVTVRPDAEGRAPSDPGVRWSDALSWAAISSVGIVATELLSRRGAEEVWRTIVGTEPPPPKPPKAVQKAEKAQQAKERRAAKAVDA
jgi:hypothetical protein